MILMSRNKKDVFVFILTNWHIFSLILQLIASCVWPEVDESTRDHDPLVRHRCSFHLLSSFEHTKMYCVLNHSACATASSDQGGFGITSTERSLHVLALDTHADGAIPITCAFDQSQITMTLRFNTCFICSLSFAFLAVPAIH